MIVIGCMCLGCSSEGGSGCLCLGCSSEGGIGCLCLGCSSKDGFKKDDNDLRRVNVSGWLFISWQF